MKNLLFLALCLVVVMSSCGGDDCTQADWVGTYTLDASTESCSSTNVSLNETIVVSASGDTDINYDGIVVTPDGCSFTDDSFFTINVSLDGDQMMVDGFGCTGTYNRN